MSALEEYRQYKDRDPLITSRILADAAIAELEGELADAAKICGGMEWRLKRARAEVKRLRSRLCATCASLETCYIDCEASQLDSWPYDGVGCKRWSARAE